MPSGHLNPGINERRKISPGMLAMLKLCRKYGRPVIWCHCSTAEKNQLRALADRGYVSPLSIGEKAEWGISLAGLDYLGSLENA